VAKTTTRNLRVIQNWEKAVDLVMDAIKAIEIRKSVRDYIAKPVEENLLETLIMAGRGAPKTGAFHISVITNGDTLKEIDDKTLDIMKNSVGFMKERASLEGYHPLYSAPVLFLISSPDIPFKETNAACAATSIIIAATALGLGSCYVVSATLAFKDDSSLQKQVGIPEDYSPVCGILVGYAGGDKFSSPRVHEITVSHH
jgi:nitroreductase